MSYEAKLLLIERGDATVDQAREAIRGALAAGDEKTARGLYRVLRRWTWKALSARRMDAELREWFDLMSSAEAHLAPIHPHVAGRLSALSDLLEDSIRFADANPDESLLRRTHLPELLVALRRRNGRARRGDLLKVLGVGQATLSQLIGVLVAKGKLDREPDGRNANLLLTLTGQELADTAARLVAARQPDRAAEEEDRLSLPAPPAKHCPEGMAFAGVGERIVAAPPEDPATLDMSEIVKSGYAAAAASVKSSGKASHTPPERLRAMSKPAEKTAIISSHERLRPPAKRNQEPSVDRPPAADPASTAILNQRGYATELLEA